MNIVPARESGSVLVELLVVIVIIAVVGIGLVLSVGNISRGQVKADRRLEATQYAVEGMEVVYNFVRNDWTCVFDHLAGGGYVHVDYDGLNCREFLLVRGGDVEEIEGGLFERALSVERVKRNGDNDIAGAVSVPKNDADDNTVKVISVVSWDEGSETYEVVYETFFARID